MATLKTIRKRIVSVKNTQKITRAMKMVAAAKLRRAQMAVVAARPFARGLESLISSIAGRDENISHPVLVARPEVKKTRFLVFTSNRGLCGGFNSNLLRRLERHLASTPGQFEVVELDVIGKKGRDFYKSRNKETHGTFLSYADILPFEEATTLANQVIEGFVAGEFDEFYLAYNQFKSALVQEVTIEKVVPISITADTASTEAKNQIDNIYEPGKREVLDGLIPKLVATQIYRAHLESLASELGARMTAMESATKNAKEMISSLTLIYNRVRQAAITRDLMDIVNGAEAIK